MHLQLSILCGTALEELNQWFFEEDDKERKYETLANLDLDICHPDDGIGEEVFQFAIRLNTTNSNESAMAGIALNVEQAAILHSILGTALSTIANTRATSIKAKRRRGRA